MHASAHPTPQATSLQYTGTLLSNAHVRSAVLPGDFQTVPVLCLHVEIDNALRTHLHVEQTYPPGCHDLCQAAAKTHREHSRVCVTVPLDHVALTARHVTTIQALPAAPVVGALTPTTAVADLFA